jgi:6-phosphofructo-2-kinase/fructose-2,6-biphosphatase 1
MMLQEKTDRIAIFDATNSTDKRRQWILDMCTSPARRPGKPTGCVFVESICDDQELIMENFRFKVSNSPDYAGMEESEALADLKNRVAKYEEAYETITDDSLSYIKIFNLSTKLLVNHIYGRMSKVIVPALMAWNIGTRPIFLCRPGQTLSDVSTDREDYVSTVNLSDSAVLNMSAHTRKRLLRGDRLGPTGKRFSDALYDFLFEEGMDFLLKRSSVMDMSATGTSISGLATFNQTLEADTRRPPFPVKIFTSTMPRAVETVTWEEYDFKIDELSNLNPLDKGDFAGRELEEIQETNPSWYRKLEQDPFATR